MICKPTNSKTRGYKSCGKESIRRMLGLCAVCFYDWMQTDERGKVYNQKVFSKKVDRLKETRRREKKRSDKEKVIKWRPKLQTKVQEIARIIDKGLACLARGTNGQIHGGHVFSKGGHSTSSLNLHNIHRQSAYSNTYLNDDGLFRDKLSQEYGKEYLEFIRSFEKHSPLKITNLEYKEKYYLACEIANELRKKGNEYDLNSRIVLRNKVNIALGIYEKEYCEFYTGS